MNNKTTRIGAALRYLAVIPLIALGILSIVGKGGGGGGGGGGGLPACGSVTDIDPNSTTNGTLSSGDCTINDLFPGSGDASFVDQYRVTLPSNGGTLTIRMDSTEIDPFVGVFDLSLQLIAFDDDSGGNFNALVMVGLSAGTYMILANSAFLTPDTGAYTLTTTFDAIEWIATSTAGAPDARTLHTLVWTGAEMIVWGGNNGNAIANNTGARFDPVTNTWTTMTTVGAPSARYNHTAIWTGTEMIVWGGFSGAFAFQALNDGAKYNPQTDTWTPITAVAAPSARLNHTAVWTGTEMIIWGGFSCTACSNPGLSSGARYNPATDTWTPTTLTAAPSARGYHTAVWTGSRMIVWGGDNDAVLTDSGDIYDPVSDSWVATNLVDAPSARRCHSAAWTGSAMIVYGGQTITTTFCGGGNMSNTGALYDPTSDSWAPTSTAGAPTTTLNFSPAAAVWSGSELLVCVGGGARYDPVTDSWSAMSLGGGAFDCQNQGRPAVWTGSKMIVWGGVGLSQTSNIGGIYDPSVDLTP